ncbi:MAG: hypothetical protein H0T53_11860 [Herpetosiphonaceae bacterium]|nr:hypothetical protein [Herpetosiphonaceae bacterium]
MNKTLYGSIARVIIALVLAAVLWVFVSFTENPQQSAPLTNLPVQAEGLAPVLTLVDANGLPIRAPNAVVNLNVVGPKDVLARVTKQNVQPYINLAGLDPGSHEVSIQARPISISRDIAFRNIAPATVVVDIDAIITATVPLTITTDGQPPTSYEANLPIATVDGQPQTTITVSGPRNKVQQVVGVEVTLDLSSQTSSLKTIRQVTPIDGQGREVEGLEVSPESVQIEVQILSSSGIKRVPIVYVVRDTAPAGLRPLITLSPAFVSIVGSSQVLADVEFIETQPIELLGATSDFTTTVRLRFPSGVSPRDAQAAETTQALVRLVPIESQFALSLPVVARNTPANTSVTLSPTVLEILISGPLSAVQSLPTLALVVDLSGRGPGTYSIIPTIDLPIGLTLAQALAPVEVTVISTITPTVPAPTEPPEPTSAPEITPPISPTVPLASPTVPVSPTATP